MVVELVDDGTPDREGRGTGDADDAHDIAGYGVEEPVHEALVLHRPLQIDKLRGGGGDLNAGKKAELPDDGVEEATLLLVGGLDDVKNHRHMGLDLHHHEGGNCWRLRTGWGGEGRRRGGGRAMGGGLKREQRVVVHGEQRKREMSAGLQGIKPS
jgi:hypothetical protein